MNLPSRIMAVIQWKWSDSSLIILAQLTFITLKYSGAASKRMQEIASPTATWRSSEPTQPRYLWWGNASQIYHIAFPKERGNMLFDLIPKCCGRASTTFKCISTSCVQVKYFLGVAAWPLLSLGCSNLRRLSVADKAVGSTSASEPPQDV